MNGFTKLFSEILTSSIWLEDDKTRILWITMLAASGPDGVVRASVGGLAHQARMDKSECAKALEVLKSPDEDSRSKEFEGRRIQDVDGGFLLLNYSKYREARSEDERKIYMAEYMRNYRKQSVNIRKQNVNTVNHSKPPLAKEEAEEEVEKNKKAFKSEEIGSHPEFENPDHKMAMKVMGSGNLKSDAYPMASRLVSKWVETLKSINPEKQYSITKRDQKAAIEALESVQFDEILRVAKKAIANKDEKSWYTHKHADNFITFCKFFNEIRKENDHSSSKPTLRPQVVV